jgi:EpsI family protein
MKFPLASLLLGGSMLCASLLAVALKPTHRMADDGPKVNLETLIPRQIGGWRIDPNVRPVQVSPDLEEALKKTYDQILERTYVDDRGRRVMVSLVYGTDELTEALSAHRPENCYYTQGFQIVLAESGTLDVGATVLPAKKLVAIQGTRQEPITYWMTVGDKVVMPGFNRRLTQAEYGLTGTIPDGVLMRVSSIGSDWEAQFEVQGKFLADLVSSVDPAHRGKLIGVL